MTYTCPECGNTSPPQPLGQIPLCMKVTKHKRRRRVEMKETK